MEAVGFEQELVLQEIKAIRKLHGKIGTGKLHGMLEPFLLEHSIKMGRDALFDLLRDQGLLVRRRRSRKLTSTDSSHPYRKHPCLIDGLALLALKVPNQLWVADITYWRVAYCRFLYISPVTDAYSHKIVGYHVSETMAASETAKALLMAIGQASPSELANLIHHSDRGVQYCSQAYVDILEGNRVGISMYQKGSNSDNNIAERMNGILKHEYLAFREARNFSEAKQVLEESIRLYNDIRPHDSIGRNTPSAVHEGGIKAVRLWKDYSKKEQG